jgi:hypothetical protein
MTKGRLDGLYMLLLGCVVFVLLGVATEIGSHVAVTDFKVLYYPARCLLQHCDPYNESDVLRLYRAEGGDRPSDPQAIREIVTRHIYLPTAFFFTVPFAMLPWGPAHILWIALIIGSFVFASFLIWNLSADYAPVLSGVMIGFLVANSEVLVITGNAAGIVVSFCAVAVWCFLRERFVVAGIVCLAISLALKPQDAGLIWLYFLLAGGVYRRRALQTLAATVALSLPGVLWVWHVAPHWMQELHSNIATSSVKGSIIDPIQATPNFMGAIHLQTVLCVFWNDPHIYNAVTYLICGPLILVWMVVTFKSRVTPARAWLGLAVITALSLLPVYHRQYDAKLLLLTVPACAMLWAEGGLTAKLALLINSVAFVFAGDIPSTIFLALVHHDPQTGFPERAITEGMVFRTPLILLVMGIFYLWLYVRRCSQDAVRPTGVEPVTSS